MPKSFTIVVILISFLIFGCGSDDPEQNEPTGSLVVNVNTSDGIPEPNVRVEIRPGNNVRTTNSEGSASFNNIAVGTYQVFLELDKDSEFYVEDEVYEVTGVQVTENETQVLDWQLLEPVRPIEEIALDLDFFLVNTYSRLKDALMFDAVGYTTYWGDIGADLATVNTGSSSVLSALDRYIFEPSNGIINDVWAVHYDAIRNSNLALEAIAEGEYTSESGKEEQLFMAEFRFLRALFYFNLLKLYGNPVFVDATSPDAFPIQDRSGVKELIEEDLLFAEANLENFTTSEIASIQAAQVLLGRFYLFSSGFPDFDTEKYELAATQFEKVLGQFSLEEDYSKVFDPGSASNNAEIIFSIDFDNSSESSGGNFGVFWGPIGYSQSDYLQLDPKFIREFFVDEADFQNSITFPLNIEDERFYNTIAPFTVQNGTAIEATDVSNWRPLKYITDITQAPEMGSSMQNFPYIRYVDVLLMLAEVENALNGPTARAYNLVNGVINRSHNSTEFELPNGLSQTGFLLKILEQRRKELCFEGLYKDDLIRNELLSEVIEDFNVRNPDIPKQFESHKYVWPIPQSEINSNPNIVQNVGY